MFGDLLRTRAASLVQALCLTLLLSAVPALEARAQHVQGLAGSWYGDLAKVETIEGKFVNHRRWLRILRRDGTFTIVFRYYLDNRLQLEAIDNGVWGQQGRLYWTQCTSQTVAGRPRPCASRYEYDVQRVDAREMAYTSRGTGILYVVTRVPDDYRLP